MDTRNHFCGKLKSKARDLWLPAVAVVSALVISPLTLAGLSDDTEQDSIEIHEGHVQDLPLLQNGDELSLVMPYTFEPLDPVDTPRVRNDE